MNNNMLSGIRLKIVLLFFFSIALSGVTLLGFYFIAVLIALYNIEPLESFLRWVYWNIGGPISIFLTGFVLFILYVFWLSRKSIRYLVEISGSLEHIANGHFDKPIPIRTNDELGELAENINWMSSQLKSSLEEERRAVQTKAELITNVSHDLRTPLTSMTGYLGLIEQDRYRDEVELRHYVSVAYEKSKRLEVLINDLFEYTRASGGGMILHKNRINLGDLLGQLAAQFAYQLHKAGMEYRLFLPEQRVDCEADGEKLVRVFENLMANAIQYGKDGKFIDIVLKRDDKRAVVQFVNYGEPIPSMALPHIFDRFYRVEQSRSEGGSGLGLAIAKGIVELHGGTIRAYSNAERTCFEVTLPVQ